MKTMLRWLFPKLDPINLEKAEYGSILFLGLVIAPLFWFGYLFTNLTIFLVAGCIIFMCFMTMMLWFFFRPNLLLIHRRQLTLIEEQNENHSK